MSDTTDAKTNLGKQKVYSPDIIPYSFEGNSYFFGTLLSIVVAPIRLTFRVMHNIFILPANMYKGYAGALTIVSAMLMLLGLLDGYLVNKWPLFVSQIFPLVFSFWLRKHAIVSTKVSSEKREVVIDTDLVEQECNTIVDEINLILEADK